MNRYILKTISTDGATYSDDVYIPFESEDDLDIVTLKYWEKLEAYEKERKEHQKIESEWESLLRKRDRSPKDEQRLATLTTARHIRPELKFLGHSESYYGLSEYWTEAQILTLEQWFESTKQEFNV